jgi:hypothetical protein
MEICEFHCIAMIYTDTFNQYILIYNDSRGTVCSHIFTDSLTHDFEMFRESLILPTKYDAAIPAESYVPFNCL